MFFSWVYKIQWKRNIIDQRRIKRLVKHLRPIALRNSEQLLSVYYFGKMLHLRCLTGFWISVQELHGNLCRYDLFTDVFRTFQKNVLSPAIKCLLQFVATMEKHIRTNVSCDKMLVREGKLLLKFMTDVARLVSIPNVIVFLSTHPFKQ